MGGFCRKSAVPLSFTLGQYEAEGRGHSVQSIGKTAAGGNRETHMKSSKRQQAGILALLGAVLLSLASCGSNSTVPTADGPLVPDSGNPTAIELLAKMTSCTRISNGLYATDAGLAPTIPVCGANGAVWWHADMDIDCDGVTTAECNINTDPAYQNDTSLHTSTGEPFNAATMPYVVVPSISARWGYSSANTELGAVMAVIYNGKVEYGVFADTGPADIIGEASYAMANALGINPDPADGGIDSGVTYMVFKGSHVSPVESQSAAASVGQTLARQFINNN